jgi:hypothetical protein
MAVKIDSQGHSFRTTSLGHCLGIEAVGLEQRHDNALQAKPQAGGVGHVAVLGADVEGGAEVLLVEVEGAHRGGLFRRDHRHQHFEFELLLFLAGGQDLAAAAEEGVGGHVGLRRQAE